MAQQTPPTPQRHSRGRSVATTILLAALLAVSFPTLSRAAQVATRQLKLAVPLEGQVSTDAGDSYALTLATDEFAKIVVRQQGLDVVVTVDSQGEQGTTRIDGTSGSSGQEVILLIGEGRTYNFQVSTSAG